MLTILHQDSELVIIVKPSGLLVHRSALAPQEAENAMAQLRDQLGKWVYPVHRLDRQASGVLLFALSSEMSSKVSELFRHHAVEKNYLALVRGWPASEGWIDRPIEGNAARTHLRVLSRFELPYASDRFPTTRVALLQLRTETGRLHQVRRHLHSISHPILGDTVHGHGASNRLLREKLSMHRLMLFGLSLSLIHPSTGLRLRAEALLDDDFQRVLSVIEPFRADSISG